MGAELNADCGGRLPCVLHVGLPKTGTTFLQKRWFPRLTGFDYYSTEPPYAWPDALRWIYELNQAWFMPACLATRATAHFGATAVARSVDEHYARWCSEGSAFVASLSRPAIFSSEGLAGHALPVTAIHAKLLHDVFGKAKVVFVFRRQAEWLHSLWRQLVVVEDRFARFLEPAELIEPNAAGNALVDLDWRAFVSVFDALFGEECVLALPYEWMLADPAAFAARLAAFIGADLAPEVDFGNRENVSEPEAKYVQWAVDPWLGSRSGYRIRRALRRPGVLSRVKRSALAGIVLREITPPTLEDAFRSRVMTEFAHSNRALAVRTGLDLAAWGYF